MDKLEIEISTGCRVTTKTDGDNGEIVTVGDSLPVIAYTRDNAIALAKHFKLTEEDLK